MHKYQSQTHGPKFAEKVQQGPPKKGRGPPTNVGAQYFLQFHLL